MDLNVSRMSVCLFILFVYLFIYFIYLLFI